MTPKQKKTKKTKKTQNVKENTKNKQNIIKKCAKTKTHGKYHPKSKKTPKTFTSTKKQ